MADCIIVSSLADEYAQKLGAISGLDVALSPYATAEEALRRYQGEQIVFGDPDLVAPMLGQLPEVAWVQSTWAGVLPFIQAQRRDYLLTGVKDVFGPQMAEFALGYLLAHELKIAARFDAQREHNWFREQSGMLAGKRLGVMGAGSIGQHIARTASSFGMQVCGLSRSGTASDGFETVMTIAELDQFLTSIDHLIATLPQTPETDHLLNDRTLALLSSEAYFVNVGRSNVVDDAALVGALKRGELGGAVLDVFDDEPLPTDSPLWDVPNLRITAHISAVSHPSLVVPIFVENLRRYQRQQELKYIVDFEVGY